MGPFEAWYICRWSELAKVSDLFEDSTFQPKRLHSLCESLTGSMTDTPKCLLLSFFFSIPTLLRKHRNEALMLFQETAKKSSWERSDLLTSHGTLVCLRQRFQTIALQISRYNYTTSQTEKNNVGNSSNVIS